MGNSILKYPGSKWRIAKQIVELIPPHRSYLEPFFGSGAVLFSKTPSPIETFNDIDGDVINLFRCVREHPVELAQAVKLTPYARETYDDSCRAADDKSDPIEKALNFLIRCWQGYGYRTNNEKVGWKSDVQGREKAYAMLDWYGLPERIIDTVDRLKHVQIENRPALEVIRRFNHENVFMYLDPPYVLESRVGKREQYKNEMTDQDHEELLKELLSSRAKIMISGYESDMYNDYLQGWEKRIFLSHAQMGKARQEVVWMNYETDKQMKLEL